MAKKEPVIPEGQLWPNLPISGAPLQIPVIAVTGEYRAGKSLFCLQIAPGVHPKGHKFEGKPRTRVYDVEKSMSTYGGTGAEIVNVIEEVQKSLTNPNDKTTKIPTDVDVYRYLLTDIEKIQPGQFDVIVIDPLTDFDGGLASYVRQNCTKFGLTTNQLTGSGGIFWGAVKNHWKIVLTSITSRCKCFAFTVHLRDEFMGAVPTGKREPKGKDTIEEIASLYLWLERKPDKDGKLPEEPSANVKKERISDTVLDPKTRRVKIVKLIPPKIPVATPWSICEYIANPPDYSKLKDEEKIVPEVMTEDERLLLRAMASRNEAQASENNLAATAHHERIVAMQTKLASSAPQNSDTTAQDQQRAAEKRTANAAETLATPSQETAAEEKPKTETAPSDAVTAESSGDFASMTDIKKLQVLLNSINWPDNKPREEYIQDCLIRAGVPQENGKVKVKKMSPKMCSDLIELAKKKLIKQGTDPEELLAGK